MTDPPSRPFDASIRIITRDGAVFRCLRVKYPRAPGSGVMSELRWVFTDADGRDHVGPFALISHDGATLQSIVEEWWATKRTPGRQSE